MQIDLESVGVWCPLQAKIFGGGGNVFDVASRGLEVAAHYIPRAIRASSLIISFEN